jgi:hypothetical protein
MSKYALKKFELRILELTGLYGDGYAKFCCIYIKKMLWSSLYIKEFVLGDL